MDGAFFLSYYPLGRGDQRKKRLRPIFRQQLECDRCHSVGAYSRHAAVIDGAFALEARAAFRRARVRPWQEVPWAVPMSSSGRRWRR